MVIRWLVLSVGVVILSGCEILSIQQGMSILPTPEVEQTYRPHPISETRPATATVAPTPDRAVEGKRRLAARVNDQPIYLDTYEQQVNQLEQALQAQGVDLASEDSQTRQAQLRQQVLAGQIDQLLIEQAAKNLGLTITEAELEVQVQESIAQQQGQVNFEEWLAANDLTAEGFKTVLRSQLIAGKVFEQITAKVPETAEQIQLQHIRVADADTAQTIIKQLKAGGHFESLAQEQSLDGAVTPDWFPQGAGQWPLEVENIAFSLEPGQVSGPIQTTQGFYIIKLKQREQERPLTTEARQALKQQIFMGWLRQQRSAAVIETFVES